MAEKENTERGKELQDLSEKKLTAAEEREIRGGVGPVDGKKPPIMPLGPVDGNK